MKISPNDRHLRSADGRTIPFSILSSGQQELLPLLLILQHQVRGMAYSGDHRQLIYVEEPEAHLFPKAQGVLVEYIASISSFLSQRCVLLITTHSPYVIAKFNNLIKAFTVSKLSGEDAPANVAGIIDKRAWLPPGAVNAYGLEGGVLTSVKDDTGLIDGRYLDSISEDLAETFLELLEAETEYGRRQMSAVQKSIKDKIEGER